MKPRYAMRDRLLTAMRACPGGKPLAAYAAADGSSHENCEKCASVLSELGQAVRMRIGHNVWWTAAEHAEAMRANIAAEKARRQAVLEAEGVIAARKARNRARKLANLHRHRAKKYGPKVARESGGRYPWPAEPQDWTPPRLVRSVFELGAA